VKNRGTALSRHLLSDALGSWMSIVGCQTGFRFDKDSTTFVILRERDDVWKSLGEAMRSKLRRAALLAPSRSALVCGQLDRDRS